MIQHHLQRRLIPIRDYKDKLAEELGDECTGMQRLSGEFMLYVDGLFAGGQFNVADLPAFQEIAPQVAGVATQVHARSSGIPTNSTVFGAMPRRPLGRGDWCTRTALEATDKPLAAALMRLSQDAEEAVYAKVAPARYARHVRAAQGILPTYRITQAFSSGILNRDARLPYHFDSGNVPGQWSMMFTFKDQCAGGNLVLPELNVIIENHHGSILLFDGQSLLHGVSGFEIAEEGHRVTIVYYTMQELFKCLPPTEEYERGKRNRDAVEERSYQELIAKKK